MMLLKHPLTRIRAMLRMKLNVKLSVSFTDFFLTLPIEMKKQLLDLNVVSNTRLNASHHLIELSSEFPLPAMIPGQFAEVKVKNQSETYLRRPFSIHRFDHATNSMHLLIKTGGVNLTTCPPL